ncbi:MAG: chitobiase/beta-hexosaminidase C-terminal domain-containing protein, partial [Phycisphaerae bacterium]|nr:chitobiase/beta-hexosaminidase C-terminal domain-containing protein [Phycisphaerae bacterium]
GGLGAAFGGAGSSAFGTRTGDVFTWVTIVLTSLFLVLAIVTTIAHRRPGGTTATPQFNPPARPIEGPIPVRITCRTSGATIRFTMDGSEPAEDSKHYDNKPLTIQPGQTIKARASRPGWDDSQVAAAHYPPLDAVLEDIEKMTEPAAASAPAAAGETTPSQAD